MKTVNKIFLIKTKECVDGVCRHYNPCGKVIPVTIVASILDDHGVMFEVLGEQTKEVLLKVREQMSNVDWFYEYEMSNKPV